MEWFTRGQIDYIDHQELHDISEIVKDKDCLSCGKCYPIKEEIPRKFEEI